MMTAPSAAVFIAASIEPRAENRELELIIPSPCCWHILMCTAAHFRNAPQKLSLPKAVISINFRKRTANLFFHVLVSPVPARQFVALLAVVVVVD